MYQCPLCKETFSRQQRLDSHLKRKTPCREPEKVRKIIIGNKDLKIQQDVISCQFCKKTFARRDNLIRHQKNFCQKGKDQQEDNIVQYFKQNNEKMALLEKQITELKDEKQKTDREIAELKEKPLISNQVLQVICVSNNDNYLDMLTEEWGNFDQALAYIKDCALSSVTGDCKLIEKVYLECQDPPSICFLDKNRTKIEYFNEKKEKVRDSKEIFGRKLANNLQNSYLKGVNYLINKNLDGHFCPNKFLEDYDLQTWNQHIYDLSDTRYQKKIISQLNIPGGSL